MWSANPPPSPAASSSLAPLESADRSAPADQPVPVEHITQNPSQRWRVHALGRRRGTGKAAAGFINRACATCQHDLTHGAWPSQRWRCNALVEKNGTGKLKASGSIYAEKTTFFGATEEGGVKALVYELGTGKATGTGERIEETSPYRCLPQHTERRWCGSGNSCVRISIFIHRYAKERTLRRQVLANVLPANLPRRNRGRNVRHRPPVSLMGSPLRL